MAKKTEVSAEVKTEAKASSASVIIGPRVTEKAAYATERNVYVFNVSKDANKFQIADAIKAQYKVTPVKVAVVVSKPKATTFRGRPGKQSAFKKAYITLKKGDTIEIN